MMFESVILFSGKIDRIKEGEFVECDSRHACSLHPDAVAYVPEGFTGDSPAVYGGRDPDIRMGESFHFWFAFSVWVKFSPKNIEVKASVLSFGSLRREHISISQITAHCGGSRNL